MSDSATVVVDTSALMAMLFGEEAGLHCITVLAEARQVLLSSATQAEALIVAARRGRRAEMEKLIARLDGDKKKLNEEMLNTADAKKAMQLHEEITKIASQLTEAEDKWVALSEELADA